MRDAQTLSVSPRGVQLHHPLQTTVFSFISNIRLIGGLLPVSADTVQKLIPNALNSKHRPLPPFALVRIKSTYPDIISKLSIRSELAGKLRQAHHRIHKWSQTMMVVVMLHYSVYNSNRASHCITIEWPTVDVISDGDKTRASLCIFVRVNNFAVVTKHPG